MANFNVVEASIEKLRDALGSGELTSVDLVAEYLQRIAKYDCQVLALNSIPILCPNVFAEASASDERRATGKLLGPLDGIPYTVKDSYLVRGLIVANGSPAFQTFRSHLDSFMVQKMRENGGIIIGQTNMPPMAYGGMQRGLYGRAENPYNKDYLAAAFASGSSNGSAVSTSASFAAFGFGSETVSSGRSPAANNGLVAYTPSRGLISARGVWPLYPTCDVVVPQTRTMSDMFEVLNVITAEDSNVQGDFWRAQPFVPIPQSWTDRPKSFKTLVEQASLKGLRIAVPSCYIGGEQLPYGQTIYTSPEVADIWEQARADLEAGGAKIVVVNEFPVVQVYDDPDCAELLGLQDIPRLPPNWNRVERGPLMARTWDAFIRDNADLDMKSLKDVNLDQIFPAVAPDHPQIAYAEPSNACHFQKLLDHLPERYDPTDPWELLHSTPLLSEALKTLESLRKTLLEDWMVRNKFDAVAFPASGDVGDANADVSHPLAEHAWKNGVKYSNGNRAIRHLGIPTVTVPMGVIEGKRIPAGLTFCGPAYSDEKLLTWAKAFESIRQRRVSPDLTPPLPRIDSLQGYKIEGKRPELQVHNFAVSAPDFSTLEEVGQVHVQLDCSVSIPQGMEGEAWQLSAVVLINGEKVTDATVGKRSKPVKDSCDEAVQYFVEVRIRTNTPPVRDDREKTVATVARDQTMVMVLVSLFNKESKSRSMSDGWYGLA